MSYIGNTQQNQSYVPAVDFFSGDGSTTAFTLSKPVATTAQIQAVISNVPQTPGVAYTVSGSTITFTSAPPSGTNNIYVYYTSPNTQVVQPGQGTVYPSSLSTGGPTWDTAGNLTLNNGAADGAQLVLKSSGYSDWNLDNYSGRLRAYYGSTEYFTINSSGNVGIGTSSPGDKLSVSGGNASFTGASNTSVSARFFNNAQTSSGFWIGQGWSSGTDNVGYLLNVANAAMVFGTNNTERMRIDSSGNLLVGTTSLNDYGKVSINFDNGGPNIGIGIKQTNNNTGTFMNFINYAGTSQGNISNNNNGTVSYNNTSDYRLKENVAPLTGALETVSQLKPCTFNYVGYDQNLSGFIAHELQAVLPEAVTGEKDAVDAEGKPVYQGIDTSFLVATLTKAIQELSAKNDALEARIATLEAK